MKIYRLLVAVLALMPAVVGVTAKGYTEYVNPFVGTDLHGHTFPAATCPFGMIQAGPDTRIGTWDGCAGYHYSDSLILGFTHTHLSGTGIVDYGDILFMPVAGQTVESHFSHGRESARPGYYQVWLEDPKVDVRIAAGRRAAMHEYTYTAGTERDVWVDLHHRDRLMGASLEMVGDRAIQGWRSSRGWARTQDVYFYAEFSEPLAGTEMVDSASVRLHFKAGKAPLKIKIAISSVSCANAKDNLYSELNASDWDLDALARRADAAWNDWLSRIEIKGTAGQKRIFYTNLYHCAIHPSLYSDANGEYRGMDRQVHKADGFERYTVFSIWDVFRATFPLYEMIARDYMPDFLESMMSVYNEHGRLPKWELAGCETNTMIGFNSVSVIADAYAKGTLPKERLKEFYEAMKATATASGESFDLFCRYGFDPAGEDDQSVSKTLEYAYDCWCIATIASVLGEKDDYARYIERAQYWKNIFDKESGFMRPRENGRWVEDFDPAKVTSHFTEANSWQYSFFVPQDIAGHIDAFGGVEAYTAKLDGLFSADNTGIETQLVDVTGLVGQYAHGNEPSHHVAYLYDFAGQAWKTQKYTRQICNEFYTAQPDGLCGNEDCGQMSAWYVMSALGLYSVTPGTDIMALTSPLFKKAVIHTGSSDFTVKANCSDRPYIQSAKLDGRAFDAAAIRFGDILDGGSLEFRMGDTPSEFGSHPVMVTSIDAPYEYEANFEADFGTAKVSEQALTMEAHPQTEYYKSYTAGGDNGLVDGKHGKKNWRAGGWQGYRGCDVDVIIDLLGTRTVSSVSAEFLQDMGNYIWMPRDMEVYTSMDGENYTLMGRFDSDVDIAEEKIVIETWTVSFAPVDASHVRVVAHLFGEIPSWHRGYGDKGFTFIDEIEVK